MTNIDNTFDVVSDVLMLVPEDMKCDEIIYIKCPICKDTMKVIKSKNGHLHIRCFGCDFTLHE